MWNAFGPEDDDKHERRVGGSGLASSRGARPLEKLNKHGVQM